MGKSTRNSSEFMQCFNPQNSNHGIYYSKSFTESKFDATNIYTVKSTT